MPKSLSSVLDANDCLMCPSRESQSEKKATRFFRKEGQVRRNKERERVGGEGKERQMESAVNQALTR